VPEIGPIGAVTFHEEMLGLVIDRARDRRRAAHTAAARVAGTVAKLDGDRLTVNVRGGQTQTVMLSTDAQIYGV
jgi:hypothetical protein